MGKEEAAPPEDASLEAVADLETFGACVGQIRSACSITATLVMSTSHAQPSIGGLLSPGWHSCHYSDAFLCSLF